MAQGRHTLQAETQLKQFDETLISFKETSDFHPDVQT